MKTNDNKTYVLEKEWDILIILDACRYDYFANQYKQYFTGNLEKIISAGSATPRWRSNNFKDFYDDIAYISSNPFIGDQQYHDFDGSKHFGKVYPVWKSNWDQSLGTVLPEYITDAGVSAAKSEKDRRLIIHYLQPHAPYLSDKDIVGFNNPNQAAAPFRALNDDSINNTFRGKIYKKLLKFCNKHKLLGNMPAWHIGQFLRLPPQSPLDTARRKYGKKGLRKLYAENLEIVLKEVCLLLDNIDTDGKKVIISSDHGELLGENNLFAHPKDSENEILLSVPWFQWEKNIYNNPEARKIQVNNSEEQQDNVSIENKLKDLGYM